jgi:hypothetical protein
VTQDVSEKTDRVIENSRKYVLPEDNVDGSKLDISSKLSIRESCEMPEFFQNSPLSGAGKHPDFQG